MALGPRGESGAREVTRQTSQAARQRGPGWCATRARTRRGGPGRAARPGMAGSPGGRSGCRGGRASARPAAARRARRRAPLPVRPAGRRGDRAAAAGRHAVPDPVLPDLPARGRRDEPAGGSRGDAGDDTAAGRRSRAAAGLPVPRTRTTWPAGTRRPAPRAFEPLPPGAPSAGGMPDRVKCLHALVAHELAVAGLEPARAARPSRPAAGGRGGQAGAAASSPHPRTEPAAPASHGAARRARAAGHVSPAAVPAAEPSQAAGWRGGDRLRHELASAAHRRR